MNFQFDMHGGWLNRPEEVGAVLASLPMPHFSSAAPHLKNSGAGKTVLLYQTVKKVLGDYVHYPPQTIGDCVGRGFAEGVDVLQCVDIAIGNQQEEFQETSHEFIYGASRVNIGHLQGLPRKANGTHEDGSCGAWAAKAVSTLGTVSRKVTGPYDDKKAAAWGETGPPSNVLSLAVNHKVRTTSLITTYSDLEDAVANGFPVTVASDQAFKLHRDNNGFCAPDPSTTWPHNMVIVGIRNDGLKGALIFQSWGDNMPSGPLSLDQPSNSFWADPATVSSMLACRDSWSLSSFDGYPAQSAKLDKALFYLG